MFGKKWRDTLLGGASELGVTLDMDQAEQMACHAGELLRWNSRINLTAIVEPQDMAVKHFIDSIALIPWLPDGAKLIDIGSGAGFPGIPLKIANPSLDVTMIDASRKKVSFLSHMIRVLFKKTPSNCTGIEALHARAGQLAMEPEYANGFDAVLARAFAPLTEFTKIAIPFLKEDGTVFAMKGDMDQGELALFDGTDFGPYRTGGRRLLKTEREIIRYTLPFGGHKRSLVKIYPVFP
ncbi:MAG: 16S rRNA (guanine(527)-N(7))-methyltransferase RsmG [Desulfamplus sp.]|nr:16S rRNA (guanine(527)-N(7))-methyltransferase RsmG [Desulfamplus sp.]